MSRPTAAESVRQIVNDFLNRQETLCKTALLFRLEYSCDDDADEDSEGEVSLTQYFMSTDPQGFTGTGTLQSGESTYRVNILQIPCILRISEEGLAPLGLWRWKFIDDTLTHICD